MAAQLLTTCAALATVVVSFGSFALKLNSQQPLRGIVSGQVQTVSNGVLTVVTDQPAFGLPQGTKVSFVLNSESMIFDGTQGKRASIPEIQNYRQAKVQYVVKGDSKVAVHIRLYQPIQSANRQPPTLSHMAEAQEHIRRGLALQKNHDLDGAIAEYRKALALDPNLCQCTQQPG